MHEKPAAPWVWRLYGARGCIDAFDVSNNISVRVMTDAMTSLVASLPVGVFVDFETGAR